MKTRRFTREVPENASKTHKELAIELKSLNPYNIFYYEYPCSKIYELYCDGVDENLKSRIYNMHMDIYDSTMKVVFEIQGTQHYEFSKFFHGTHDRFDAQKNRDSDKVFLCKLARIKLVTVPINIEICPKTVLAYYCESE